MHKIFPKKDDKDQYCLHTLSEEDDNDPAKYLLNSSGVNKLFNKYDLFIIRFEEDIYKLTYSPFRQQFGWVEMFGKVVEILDNEYFNTPSQAIENAFFHRGTVTRAFDSVDEYIEWEEDNWILDRDVDASGDESVHTNSDSEHEEIVALDSDELEQAKSELMKEALKDTDGFVGRFRGSEDSLTFINTKNPTGYDMDEDYCFD